MTSNIVLNVTHVINDDGGINHPSDFINRILAENLFPRSFYGEASPGTEIRFNGDYNVTQNRDSRYETTFSKQCSGHARDFRQILISTITNDDKPKGGGVLNIVGEVINDNGGIRNIEEFIVLANGNNISNQAFITNERPGIEVTMEPGKYNVTEKAMWGYSVKYLGDCSGFMKAWDTKICKIVNNDIPGNGGLLTIVQRVINDERKPVSAGQPILGNGIDSSINLNSFRILINNSDAFPSSIDGKEDLNGTEVALKNGSYSVFVDSISKNYSYSFSPECSDDIKNGQGKICIIIADDLLNQNNTIGKLMVIHRVINNDGLGRAPISFASTVEGNCFEACRIAGFNESFPLNIAIKEYSMNEGNYHVSFHPDANYSISASEECDGYIQEGEVKTYQLTIDDKPKTEEKYGTLVIKQYVINANGGNKTANDFKIYIGPHSIVTNQTSFNGSEDGTKVKIKIPLSTSEYIVSQEGPKNYISYFSRDCANIIHDRETNLCMIISEDK